MNNTRIGKPLLTGPMYTVMGPTILFNEVTSDTVTPAMPAKILPINEGDYAVTLASPDVNWDANAGYPLDTLRVA